MHVISCQVGSGFLVPRPDDVGLWVRFRNDGTTPLSSIVWRVKYGKSAVDVFDDGLFSPGVRIDNYALAEQGSTHINLTAAALTLGALNVPLTKSNLALPPYLSTADPENCAILRATYANGDVWTNPQLDQTTTMLGIPTPIPTPTAQPSDETKREPIQISHCTLIAAVESRLELVFQNASPATVDRIVVRGAYGSSGIDFADAGSFSPSALVHHWLKHAKIDDLRQQVYWSFDDPANCTVVSVHAKDGSTWQNPAVSESPGPLPTTVPDVMWVIPKTWQRHASPSPVPAAELTPAAVPTVAPSP